MNKNTFSLNLPLSQLQKLKKCCQQSPIEVFLAKDFQNQTAITVKKNSDEIHGFIVPWGQIHNSFHLAHRALEIMKVLYVYSKLLALKDIHSDSVFLLYFVGLHCSQTILSAITITQF